MTLRLAILAIVNLLLIFCTLAVRSQIMPPTGADMAWTMADTTPPAKAVIAQPTVTLMWECYDYDYGYFTGLDASTNLTDWICVAGFPATATNKVSLPKADIMFFRRWMCETNRF